MPELEKLEELSNSMKQYLLLNIKILKLEATKQISTLGSAAASSLVVGISALLFVLTMSISLGFYLSDLLHSSYLGFAIVAMFYFLLTIVLFAGRKRMIKQPLRNKIVEKILENA
jgi:hypothetical protein